MRSPRRREIALRIFLVVVLYVVVVGAVLVAYSFISARSIGQVLGNLWIPVLIFLGLVVWQAVRGRWPSE